MRNPFANPLTVRQWLLSSLCWVGSCLAGFYGSVYGVATLLPHSGDLVGWVFFGSAMVVCALMWRRVIAIGWQLQPAGEPTWLVVCGGVWRLLLTFLLIASVVLIGIGVFITLAFMASPDSGGSF